MSEAVVLDDDKFSKIQARLPVRNEQGYNAITGPVASDSVREQKVGCQKVPHRNRRSPCMCMCKLVIIRCMNYD